MTPGGRCQAWCIATWLARLGDTHRSIALHDAHYVWLFAESLHVLTLALFVGTTAVLDLRLLGVALRRVPVTTLTARLLPCTRFGSALMIASGPLLFRATPPNYYHDFFFRVKMLLEAIAGVNVLVFHARTRRDARACAYEVHVPRGARLGTAISIVAWGGAIVSGRLIAHACFACEKRSILAFADWVSDCPGTRPRRQ